MADLPSSQLAIQDLIDTQVVLDTDSHYVYIGNLESATSDYYVLTNLDAHDTSDTRTSKEYYTHETKTIGPRVNRKRTYVRVARVVSICKLDDVVSF